MSLEESRNRIKARAWKAIAQSDLDLTAIPKESVESVVELVTDAALIEIDEELGKSLSSEKPEDQTEDGGEGEKVLWRGRPFLSVSKSYVITTERLRVIEGLLGKDREDIELIRIQDMDQSQTLRERLLNLGDITVRSHDSSHPAMVLNNIRDPQTVHEILRRAVLDARKRYRLIYREEM